MNDSAAPAPPAPRRLDDCWNRIGIGGDRSCLELQTHVHCRNCPVHAEAARGFFDRPAPDDYVDEWTRWLGGDAQRDETRQEEFVSRRDDVGVLIFRLGPEWLAFATRAVEEAALPRPVHRIPHRSNAVLRGLVSLRGRPQLCVSLHGLLGAPEPKPDDDHAAASSTRLIVLRDLERTESWAFAADAVHGVEHFARESLQKVPSTLANPAVSFSQAVIPWNDRSVGLLDEARVFAALRSVDR